MTQRREHPASKRAFAILQQKAEEKRRAGVPGYGGISRSSSASPKHIADRWRAVLKAKGVLAEDQSAADDPADNEQAAPSQPSAATSDAWTRVSTEKGLLK